MTREKVINYLKSSGMSEEQIKDIISAFTCEDCISRQAVLDVIEREEFKGDAISEIEKLSSVTPQPKAGYWITYKLNQGGIDEERLECSVCMCTLSIPRNYCPNCGARMVESEDKV